MSIRSRGAMIVSGSMRFSGGLSKVARQYESERLLMASGDEFFMMIIAFLSEPYLRRPRAQPTPPAKGRRVHQETSRCPPSMS
jgi:hypothetical protein